MQEGLWCTAGRGGNPMLTPRKLRAAPGLRASVRRNRASSGMRAAGRPRRGGPGYVALAPCCQTLGHATLPIRCVAGRGPDDGLSSRGGNGVASGQRHPVAGPLGRASRAPRSRGPTALIRAAGSPGSGGLDDHRMPCRSQEGIGLVPPGLQRLGDGGSSYPGGWTTGRVVHDEASHRMSISPTGRPRRDAASRWSRVRAEAASPARWGPIVISRYRLPANSAQHEVRDRGHPVGVASGRSPRRRPRCVRPTE
jgi:hypothetical protein